MKAEIYRMETDQHKCPFGIKSKKLLEAEGFELDDHLLRTREEIDNFKQKYGVETTPQSFIDGKRVGGYEELVKYFGKSTLKQEGTTYQPIIAVFSVTFFMALAFNWFQFSQLSFIPVVESFVAISMCVLAILKLRDLYSFSNQFITYDLLAKRYLGYAYIYPFAEALAGIGMIAQVFIPFVASTSLFIGTIGAISVIKAVYIEKREIKCACVGGDSNVPLGFISLTENLMMILIGTWMLFFKAI